MGPEAMLRARIVRAGGRGRRLLRGVALARGRGETPLQEQIRAGTVVDTPRERLHARLLGLAETYVEFVSANANRWSALLAFNRTRAVGESEDNLQHLNALIDILGDVLKESPRWRTPAERRLAGRALWSAVHGVVVTSYFGDDRPARQRTLHLLDLLLGTIADGAFVAPTGHG